MDAVCSIGGEGSVESLLHTGSTVHPGVPSLTQLCLQTPGLPEKLLGLQTCSWSGARPEGLQTAWRVSGQTALATLAAWSLSPQSPETRLAEGEAHNSKARELRAHHPGFSGSRLSGSRLLALSFNLALGNCSSPGL